MARITGGNDDLGLRFFGRARNRGLRGLFLDHDHLTAFRLIRRGTVFASPILSFALAFLPFDEFHLRFLGII
ncbi:hypothetical protein FACS189493_3280 [Spirochaetia bacterium]|nr:hypothetical protein FACS189493_3280 [Spirochaetia bacterium]